MPAPCDEAPNPAPFARRLRTASRKNKISPTAMPNTPVITTNSATRSGCPPICLAASSANGVVIDRTARLRCTSSGSVNRRASHTELYTATSTAVVTPAVSDSQWRRMICRFSYTGTAKAMVAGPSSHSSQWVSPM